MPSPRARHRATGGPREAKLDWNRLIDLVHYYAFILDALARYPGSRVRLAPYRWTPWRSGRKPVMPVLTAAARALPAAAAPDGILEFGVWKGSTIRHLAALLPGRQIHGFDSFEGFPEDGRPDWRLDFALDSLPRVPANVELVTGFFEESLPAFLASRRSGFRIDFLHVDCDIYSSTSTIFRCLQPHLGAGAVIVFDELLNYHRFPENECLAFYEFLMETGLDFDWLVTVGPAYPFAQFCDKEVGKGDMQWYRNAGYYQNSAVRLTRAVDRPARIDRYRAEAERLLAVRPLKQPLVAPVAGKLR